MKKSQSLLEGSAVTRFENSLTLGPKPTILPCKHQSGLYRACLKTARGWGEGQYNFCDVREGQFYSDKSLVKEGLGKRVELQVM